MIFSSFRLPVVRIALQRNQVCYLQSPLFQNLSCLYHTFKFSDLNISLVNSETPKPDEKSLKFGKTFSDHMLEIEWTEENGWGKPSISPLHNLCLHPAAKVLHYAQELFEGMKAFRSSSGKILLFRPDLNIQRMLVTSERASLPKFDGNEFLMCLRKLISIDKEWVPSRENCSLYIRPTFIGIEASLGIAAAKKALLYVITGPVGSYFTTGEQKPVSLLADPNYIRSWPGGVGNRKMGCNYAPTIHIQQLAERQNHQQVLWLYGENHQLVEVGTMNIFVFLINANGDQELVTPPLDDLILPGVVRQSLLELAREWNEFKVSERYITMQEVLTAKEENKLLEIFGSGTACVVCPVGSITYMGKTITIPTADSKVALCKRFFTALQDIQYGRTPSKWSISVD